MDPLKSPGSAFASLVLYSHNDRHVLAIEIIEEEDPKSRDRPLLLLSYSDRRRSCVLLCPIKAYISNIILVPDDYTRGSRFIRSLACSLSRKKQRNVRKNGEKTGKT